MSIAGLGTDGGPVGGRKASARPRPSGRFLAAIVAAALAGASAPIAVGSTTRATTCVEGTESRLVVELLFGRNIGRKLGVSEEQFQRFVDQEVTPRFPDGFTLVDTIGQWRPTSSREIVREPGKQLVIALADDEAGMPLVREIIDAYKRQFSQQSVGVITRQSCVSF